MGMQGGSYFSNNRKLPETIESSTGQVWELDLDPLLYEGWIWGVFKNLIKFHKSLNVI